MKVVMRWECEGSVEVGSVSILCFAHCSCALDKNKLQAKYLMCLTYMCQ